jgi:hypothetical protein
MTKLSASAPPGSSPQTPAARRAAEAEARLAAALRENLRRRKAQSRAREAGQAESPTPASPPEQG